MSGCGMGLVVIEQEGREGEIARFLLICDSLVIGDYGRVVQGRRRPHDQINIPKSSINNESAITHQ
jgi:hypothetical protein